MYAEVGELAYHPYYYLYIIIYILAAALVALVLFASSGFNASRDQPKLIKPSKNVLFTFSGKITQTNFQIHAGKIKNDIYIVTVFKIVSRRIDSVTSDFRNN